MSTLIAGDYLMSEKNMPTFLSPASFKIDDTCLVWHGAFRSKCCQAPSRNFWVRLFFIWELNDILFSTFSYACLADTPLQISNRSFHKIG